MKELKVYPLCIPWASIDKVESGEGIERERRTHITTTEGTLAWNPVKELKACRDSRLGSPRARWNPVKELKDNLLSQYSPFCVL